jgi:RimJ/RimL family protein N-acetyltransferase
MQLRSGELVLQGFAPALSGELFHVRNHPSVRRYLRITEPLAWEDHERWVHENLVAQRRVHLFLAYSAGAAVGLALLRNFTGLQAEIGVMMVEAHRRRLAAYKAAHLVGYYGFEILGLQRLLSYVPRHNTHALRFNEACGFTRTGQDSEPYFELALGREESRTHPAHRRFRSRYPITVS